MKWYNPSEKTPKDKTLVVVWGSSGHRPDVLDSRYDRTVYNTYKLALYSDNKWLDIADFNFDVNLADTYNIDKWIEVPFEYGFKHGKGYYHKLEKLDPIDDRFEILDL